MSNIEKSVLQVTVYDPETYRTNYQVRVVPLKELIKFAIASQRITTIEGYSISYEAIFDGYFVDKHGQVSSKRVTNSTLKQRRLKSCKSVNRDVRHFNIMCRCGTYRIATATMMEMADKFFSQKQSVGVASIEMTTVDMLQQIKGSEDGTFVKDSEQLVYMYASDFNEAVLTFVDQLDQGALRESDVIEDASSGNEVVAVIFDKSTGAYRKFDVEVKAEIKLKKA